MGTSSWERQVLTLGQDAGLSLLQGKEKMWQGPVLSPWSMTGPPSAVELTAADPELRGRLFHSLGEPGQHHFPGELGSLAVAQIVF